MFTLYIWLHLLCCSYPALGAIIKCTCYQMFSIVLLIHIHIYSNSNYDSLLIIHFNIFYLRSGLMENWSADSFTNIKNQWTFLNHWGRVTHICVGKLTLIGSDKGLSPGRRQAIIWTNAGILLRYPLGTNFSEILIEFYTFSFKKMHLKTSSAKWRLVYLGRNELMFMQPGKPILLTRLLNPPPSRSQLYLDYPIFSNYHLSWIMQWHIGVKIAPVYFTINLSIGFDYSSSHNSTHITSQIAKFMGPTRGPPGPCRPQMGPLLVLGTLVSGIVTFTHIVITDRRHLIHLCRRTM